MDKLIFELIRNGDGRQKRAWAQTLYLDIMDFFMGKGYRNPIFGVELESLNYIKRHNYVMEALRVLETVSGFEPHIKKLREAPERILDPVQVEARVFAHYDGGRIVQAEFPENHSRGGCQFLPKIPVDIDSIVLVDSGYVISPRHSGGMETLRVLNLSNPDLRVGEVLADNFPGVEYTPRYRINFKNACIK